MRGLLRDCENFADGSFAALLLLPVWPCVWRGEGGLSSVSTLSVNPFQLFWILWMWTARTGHEILMSRRHDQTMRSWPDSYNNTNLLFQNIFISVRNSFGQDPNMT